LNDIHDGHYDDDDGDYHDDDDHDNDNIDIKVVFDLHNCHHQHDMNIQASHQKYNRSNINISIATNIILFSEHISTKTTK